MKKVTAKNVRGPYPGGQCFQIAQSDGTKLHDFHCHNELEVAWPEDSISVWRSSNVELKNGVVEGSNAPTGICVMFEGSESHVHGGLIQDVEVTGCQGCFSGYPANGLVQRHNFCVNTACNGSKLRGRKGIDGKGWINFWAAGDNKREGVIAKNVQVYDSWYDKLCPERNRVYWEARKGKSFTVKEMKQLKGPYTPKPRPKAEFRWDKCHIAPPATKC